MVGYLMNFYCKFTAECDGKRILKIG